VGFSDVTRGKREEFLFEDKPGRIILNCLVEFFCGEKQS
jgi:hypothetical protein